MTPAAANRTAQLLAIAVPAALLTGAYISQYVFGLPPCEMCWWQRYPHFIAIPLALAALVIPPRRLWVSLAAVAVIVSGLIGLFHAGVEYDWWEGITPCAAPPASGGDVLEAVFNTPLIRCDRAPWTLMGISLAGWNFLISTGAGIAILALLRKGARAA